MSETADALQWLEGVASEFGATLTVIGAKATARVIVTLPSGRQYPFALALMAAGEQVTVQEAPVGQLLPAFCPDRHINSDGSFCLGWGPEGPGKVTDVASARSWWSALVRFLAYQLSANKRGVWPGRENDRAHGDAATNQAIAEEVAESFGLAFVRDLHSGALTVRSDGRRRNPRLELYRNGRRIARVFLQLQRLVTDRIRCPCEASTALAIADCASHAQDLECFTVAFYQWRQKERGYLRALANSGQLCCGTLRECGLRDARARIRVTPSQDGQAHEFHARTPQTR